MGAVTPLTPALSPLRGEGEDGREADGVSRILTRIEAERKTKAERWISGTGIHPLTPGPLPVEGRGRKNGGPYVPTI